MNKLNSKTVLMTQCALFAAILCIFSPITIPIGPIPISLGIFGVMLTGVILGWKKGLLSVLIYLLIGMLGVPLFSGGRSGLEALLGPTGGYVWSYLFVVIIIGLITGIVLKNKTIAIIVAIIACTIGVMICYLFGTIQFMVITGYHLKEALAVCVIPFIPFDFIKVVCASVLGVSIRAILRKTGYL